jgi:hypothetical protein
MRPNNNLPLEDSCMLPVRTRSHQIARERDLDHQKTTWVRSGDACQEVTATIGAQLRCRLGGL